MRSLIINKHIIKAERKETTVFESPKKHAEFVEHLRDMRTRDIDRQNIRQDRFGDENNSIKILGIML